MLKFAIQLENEYNVKAFRDDWTFFISEKDENYVEVIDSRIFEREEWESLLG